MAERYRQSTYGTEIESCEREIVRLAEVAKRVPHRAHEVEQGRALVAALNAQMHRLGKRRSSCFYGLEQVPA